MQTGVLDVGRSKNSLKNAVLDNIVLEVTSSLPHCSLQWLITSVN